MKNQLLKQTILIVLVWWLAIYFFVLIGLIGPYDDFDQKQMFDHLDSFYFHLEIFLHALVFGVVFSLVRELTETTVFRRKSFSTIVIVRSAFYFISIFLVGLISYGLLKASGYINADKLEFLIVNSSQAFIIALAFYYVALALFLNGIIEVYHKLGPHEWINLLTGRYQSPKTEQLIFCFIDLKGSTGAAENLGHSAYSNFLKDSFHELTSAIRETKARVYQYAGDEVILYWPKKEGVQNMNCIKAFYIYLDALQEKETFFMEKYGLTPFFKCGSDIGKVTITEIGDIKRELAFHGNALNTASRLEKKCGECNELFLASHQLISQLEQNDEFSFSNMGKEILRGKNELVEIYAVNRS